MDSIEATPPRPSEHPAFSITLQEHEHDEVLVTLASAAAADAGYLREVWYDGVHDEYAQTGDAPRLLDGSGTRALMPAGLAPRALARFLVSSRPRRRRSIAYGAAVIDLGPVSWEDLWDAFLPLNDPRARPPLERSIGTPAWNEEERGRQCAEATVIIRAGLDGTPAMLGVEHHCRPTSGALGHLVARALRERVPKTSLDGARVREVLESEDSVIGPRVVRLEQTVVARAVDDWRDDDDVAAALESGRIALDWRLGRCRDSSLRPNPLPYPGRPTRRPETVAEFVDALRGSSGSLLCDATPCWFPSGDLTRAPQ